MRRPRPLPRTQSADIDRLKKRRAQLVHDRKSTAIVDRLITIEVCRQIRREVRNAS